MLKIVRQPDFYPYSQNSVSREQLIQAATVSTEKPTYQY